MSAYDASLICSDKSDADFYETLIINTRHYKAVANWLTGPLKSYCNENGISFNTLPIQSVTLAQLVDLTAEGKVSFNNASTKLLRALIANPGKTPMEMAVELNLLQDSDEESIDKLVTNVLTALPGKVKEFRNGKKGLIGLFAGEVKKMSKGKADMELVNKLLIEKLNNHK